MSRIRLFTNEKKLGLSILKVTRTGERLSIDKRSLRGRRRTVENFGTVRDISCRSHATDVAYKFKSKISRKSKDLTCPRRLYAVFLLCSLQQASVERCPSCGGLSPGYFDVISLNKNIKV